VERVGAVKPEEIVDVMFTVAMQMVKDSGVRHPDDVGGQVLTAVEVSMATMSELVSRGVLEYRV
jgi:hypothetical protein